MWTPTFYDPYSDNLLKYLSKKFEVKPLKEILVPIKKGNEIGSENYVDYLSKSKNDIPFVRTSDIFNYEVDSYPDFYTSKYLSSELKQDFCAGDIVLNNDGKIGYIAILTGLDIAVFQSHIRRLRTKTPSDIPNEYIFLCLILKEIGQSQFKKYTVIQSTIPTLANRIEKIRIPIIKKELRLELSDKIKYSFKLIEKKKALVKEIKQKINRLVEKKD